MLEIRLVGFKVQDLEELSSLVAEVMDSHGLKAESFLTFDIAYTRRCLDGRPHPHVVVCSDNQEQLDIAARAMNTTLGVMVRVELCQELLVPLPIDDWSQRGR